MENSGSVLIYRRVQASSDDRAAKYGVSFRAVTAGLLIGILVNASNTYYGLRIGSGSQMPMISAILGFSCFKVFTATSRRASRLTRQENVLIVSVATAVGCMPITVGTTGSIPALEFLITADEGGPFHLPFRRLLVWSVGVAFFGIIFAYLLREPLILNSKLPWPGPHATAYLLDTLHPSPVCSRAGSVDGDNHSSHFVHVSHDESPLSSSVAAYDGFEWSGRVRTLLQGTVLSATITVSSYFLPVFHHVPIFGSYVAREWSWFVDLSPGFVGLGIIIGPAVAFHMLCGAITGWAVLAPYARSRGWTPGAVDEWTDGTRGWTIWIVMATFLADTTIKLAWLVGRPVLGYIRRLLSHSRSRHGNPSSGAHYAALATEDDGNPVEDIAAADAQHTVELGKSQAADHTYKSFLDSRALLLAFVVTVAICIFTVDFGMHGVLPPQTTVLAVILSFPAAAIGIQSLAEVDINPEMTILTQLVFALVASRSMTNAIILNLLAACLTKAGTNQSGDIAYDLKVGFLSRAHPDAQLVGHCIGSVFGAFVSCLMYRLYTSQYTIPSAQFEVPSAHLELSMARFLLGRSLPPGVLPFVCAAAALTTIASVIKIRYEDRWWQSLIPSGVAFTMGVYLLPALSISRVVGGLYAWYCSRFKPADSDNITILASGLILGESVAGLINTALTALQVPSLDLGT